MFTNKVHYIKILPVTFIMVIKSLWNRLCVIYLYIYIYTYVLHIILIF